MMNLIWKLRNFWSTIPITHFISDCRRNDIASPKTTKVYWFNGSHNTPVWLSETTMFSINYSVQYIYSVPYKKALILNLAIESQKEIKRKKKERCKIQNLSRFCICDVFYIFYYIHGLSHVYTIFASFTLDVPLRQLDIPLSNAIRRGQTLCLCSYT